MQRDEDYIRKRVLGMELPGIRKWGRPKRRFMDVVKKDMRALRLTEEEAMDRGVWRRKIRCADP